MNLIASARKRIPINDCGEQLITLDPNEFILESRYFTQGYKKDPEIRLRKSVIEKLRKAKAILQKNPATKNWQIKIWDGYRTLKTQQILYENYWQDLEKENPGWTEKQFRKAVEVFVSPASRNHRAPAPHNTGGAIDLTLIDENGNDIDMGTDFDEFSVRAFTDHFKGKNSDVHFNRMLLKNTLEKAGFVNYPEEWWHFSYGDQFWAASIGLDKAIYGSSELQN